MAGRAREGAVEVHHMEFAPALVAPVARLGGGIVAVRRHVVRAPLAKPHAHAALQVNSR